MFLAQIHPPQLLMSLQFHTNCKFKDDNNANITVIIIIFIIILVVTIIVIML